jgi:chromate reductase
MKKSYHFVAISGSIRKGSYNTLVLKTLQKLAPRHMTIEQLSIKEVPFYNGDLHEKKFPAHVERLNDAIKKADAVIFVTPEYNYSVPGVLKNTIDIISRSPKKPFDMKAVGIMGASPGVLGTSRAQYHLRQSMVFLNAYAMNQPEIMIGKVNEKFDANNKLSDGETEKKLLEFLEALAKFSDRFKPAS